MEDDWIESELNRTRFSTYGRQRLAVMLFNFLDFFLYDGDSNFDFVNLCELDCWIKIVVYLIKKVLHSGQLLGLLTQLQVLIIILW